MPTGVLELELVFQFGSADLTHPDVAGRFMTSTLRFWAPTLGLLGRLRRDQFVDELAAFYRAFASAVTCQHVFTTEARFRWHGEAYFQRILPLSDANGRWPGQALANAAVGVYWRTHRGGRRGHAISYYPTFPDDWTDDGAQLNSNGFNSVRDSAVTFLSDVQRHADAYDIACVPCLVRRQGGGAPLPRALVDFITGGDACAHVADMGRRVVRRAHVTVS